MFINKIEINIITFKKIRNRHKKKQINFEYNKNLNYTFVTIEKFVKTIYNKIEKSNPFDSTYRNNMRIIVIIIVEIFDKLLLLLLSNKKEMKKINFNR